jgi:hypothetical protein
MPMDSGGEISNGEIIWRLEALRSEVKDMASTFVRMDLHESQRTDTGRRVGEVERSLGIAQAAIDAVKKDAEARYRTTVNLALGAFLSFLGGVVLMILNLVAK